MLIFHISGVVFAQAPVIEKKFDWYQRGYYILNPAIANVTDGVAFTRQLSGKDSSVSNNTFLFNVKTNYLPQADVAKRMYDPVICIINTQNRQLSLIDYGWSPVFSATDKAVAYTYQHNPLQKDDKLYAASLKGNTIKVFVTYSGKTLEVAKPINSFLLHPFFMDTATIVYEVGNTINGPYGGGISLNSVNIKTGKEFPVRMPVIRYRHYELIGDTYVINKKLAYTVYSPQDTGQGMANEYLHLLLSGKDTLHNFGIHRYTNLAYKFAYNTNNELVFLSDDQFLPEDTNYVVKYKGENAIERKALPMQYVSAYLSPNAKYIVYTNAANEAFLYDIKTDAQTAISIPKTGFHTIIWSANSTKFLVVQDHATYLGTDVLNLFEVKK